MIRGLELFAVLGCCLSALAPYRSTLAQDWIYAVRPGDNLWNLTEEYLIDMSYWQPLRKLNHIADPLHIPPGTQLRIPVSWISQYPIIARISNLQGRAEIIEPENGKISVAVEGAFVFMGETVQTKANASLIMEFVDGSKVLLQPDSRLELSYLSIYGTTGMVDSRIRLGQGRVETKVKKKRGPGSRFEITTPAGITSVRGTDYRVSAEPAVARSHTEVLEGKVSVSSAGSKALIPGGYGTVSTSSTPPIPPVKLLAAIDTELIPKLFERVPIQFALSPAPAIKGYRLQIAKSQSFENMLFDRKYDGELIRGPDLPDGDYFARIRAIDGNGLEGTNAEFSLALNARPEAPFLQEPKPDAGLFEETPVFVWARQKDIDRYHFQLARDKRFKDLVVDLPDVQDTHLGGGYRLELEQYYWRVASIGTVEGHGPFSDLQTFKRLKPAPQAEAPEISDTLLALRWPADLPGVKYRVQMARDEAFTELVIDKTTSEPTLTIDRPESGDYYVRFSTAYQDGFISPFGKPQMIEVPSSGLYWWLLTLLPLALLAL